MEKEFQRWTAKRKVELLLQLIKRKHPRRPPEDARANSTGRASGNRPMAGEKRRDWNRFGTTGV
jgi:hypothetical protein